MFYQIEITTACNFRCFYCIGRTWQARHMKMALFNSILGRLPRGKHVVSLQGEGEPLTHPQFWTMAELVKDAGLCPYTITNGSLVDAKRMAALFPVVGFSLDTLDAREAERIGRLRLKQVLQRFIALYREMGPERIVVHSVDYGQDLGPLRSQLARLGFKQHVIQPIQIKSDYRKRYPEIDFLENAVVPCSPCRHLTASTTRFFSVHGVELPCAYIKNIADYVSDDELRREQRAGKVPKVCEGCRELIGASK